MCPQISRSALIVPIRLVRSLFYVIFVLVVAAGPAVPAAGADNIAIFQVTAAGTCTRCSSGVSFTGSFEVDLTTGTVTRGIMSMFDSADLAFSPVTLPFNSQGIQSQAPYGSGSNVYLLFGQPNAPGTLSAFSNVELIFPFSSFPSSYSGGPLCVQAAIPSCAFLTSKGQIGTNDSIMGFSFPPLFISSGSVTADVIGQPVPLLNSVAPSAAAPGGPSFTLSVIGAGFLPNAVVNWNASPRATAFVDFDHLTATITAADIASAGTAAITVTNPAPGGGTSRPQYFEVTAPQTATNFDVFNPTEIVGFASNRSNLVVGDFNNDGKLDWAGYLNGTVWVFLGNGDGTFQRPIPSPGPPQSSSSTNPNTYIATADLNGDGKPDLVVMNANGTFVALGNGDGTLRLLGTSLSDVISLGLLVIGDFNGDGFRDLAYVTSVTGVPSAIQVQLGNGDGTFRAGPRTSFSGASSQSLKYALAAGDFHGNGNVDLVASVVDTAGCTAQNYLVFVFPGNGDGSFASPSQVPGTTSCGNQGPLNAVVADFNGDGLLDIAYFNVQANTGVGPGAGFLSVSLGNGPGTFIRTPFKVVDTPNATTFPMVGPLLVGDFDGDGKLDLLTGNRFFYGNGNGAFTAGPAQGNGLQAVQAGDFDGDGNADLLALGVNPNNSSQFDIQLLRQVPGAPDFYGGVSPQSQTAVSGGSATYTISQVAVNGFNGTVTPTGSNLPAGVTATFSPPTVTGSGSTTLTLTAANTVPVGSYRITLTGTSGSLSHSTFVDLTVSSSVGDFVGSTAAGSDSIANINSGQTATYSFQVSPIGGFTGDVTMSVSGLPPGSMGTFNPAVIHGASGTTTLTVVTPASTPTNVYTLTITGTSGALAHSGTVSLGVRSTPGDWSGSITPSLYIAAGGTGSFTVNTFGFNGFTNDINLSISGLPPGVQAVYSPGSTVFGGTGSATLTISAPPGTPTGTYQLISTGSGGGRIRSGVATLIIQ